MAQLQTAVIFCATARTTLSLSLSLYLLDVQDLRRRDICLEANTLISESWHLISEFCGVSPKNVSWCHDTERWCWRCIQTEGPSCPFVIVHANSSEGDTQVIKQSHLFSLVFLYKYWL